MNESQRTESPAAWASHEEVMSALFANLVVQQTNMALMFLGQMANPETGKTIKDIDAARMFIDQLEMLEGKTKGNLNPQEEKLLKQSLTALRMAFVEAVDSQIDQSAIKTPAPPPDKAKTSDPGPSAPATATSETAAQEDSRKKFTKKY